MLIVVGDLCRLLYSVVSYLYVSFSGLITSVGEERAYCSAIVYSFPHLLGAWDRRHYFIVKLPGLSK